MKTQVKNLQVVFFSLMIGIVLSSCGIKQSDYESVIKERNEIQQKYDALYSETADWRNLSDTEKAQAKANAEAERVKAEKAAKKAKEEKAAADAAKKAEDEKQAAVEKAKADAEAKKGYNTGITYNQLARMPDDYKYKKVKFTGKVLQVMQGDNEIQLRVATKKSDYGSYYDDVLLVTYSPSIVTSRVLEDDMITLYGVSEGLYTYKSTMGGDITIPLVSIDRIDQ